MKEFRFGPYTLGVVSRSLSRQGDVIPLGSRAIDILLFLVSEPGRLRSNDEIISHAWPETFVDRANLRVHISAIRKALGDTRREPEFIANIPGRGYRFIAAVERHAAPDHRPRPLGPSGIYGRSEAIAAIARLLPGGMVTVVGPGGIGKSTVARAVTDHLDVRTRLLWIDLAELDEGAHLAATVASALGLTPNRPDILEVIATTLLADDKLLVLDGCEHVVDHAATLVETLRGRVPSLLILATSREPLRVAGERIYRLPPLDVPQAQMTADGRPHTSAMQLFLDRAAAQLGDAELGAEDIRHVAEICRRLDGIALAIELAAARLESVSLSELSASLDHSFRLLTRGRRNARPRHRTLRATLDWSYDVLPPAQQMALLHLSVLRGWFSIATAGGVLTVTPDDLIHDLIHELVSKSLVVADARGTSTRYRLLDTTRLYAAEKLAEAGGHHVVMARLATCLIELLEAAEDGPYAAGDGSHITFSELVPHLRVALAWSLKDDPALGVKLTVASVPLFFRLSLIDECLDGVTRATLYLDAHPGLDERRRMKLYAALGWPQMRPTGGPRNGVAAWETALAIAGALKDIDYQLRALWALWVDAINQAQPVQGLRLARAFADRAGQSPDPVDRVVAQRLLGATQHWLGRHEASLRQLQRMLDDYEALPPGNAAIRFQFDQRIVARVVMTRALWILGQDGEALHLVEETIRQATGMQHDLSLVNYLAEAACPVALLSGRLDLADGYIALLRHHTKGLSLDVWNSYADCFQAELDLRRGDPARCLDALRLSCEVLRDAGFVLFHTYFQSIEAQALAALGRHADAIHTIDLALDACMASGERWCLADLHRVKSRLMVAEAADGWRSRATALLHAAIDAAQADGARAWELRATRDLARLSDGSPADVPVRMSLPPGALDTAPEHPPQAPLQ